MSISHLSFSSLLAWRMSCTVLEPVSQAQPKTHPQGHGLLLFAMKLIFVPLGGRIRLLMSHPRHAEQQSLGWWCSRFRSSSFSCLGWVCFLHVPLKWCKLRDCSVRFSIKYSPHASGNEGIGFNLGKIRTSEQQSLLLP